MERIGEGVRLPNRNPIYDLGALRRELGATFRGNLINFGRVLTNMEGLRQKRSKLGKLYLVRRRQP